MKKLYVIRRVLAGLICACMICSISACTKDKTPKDDQSFNLSKADKVNNYFDSNDAGIPAGLDYIMDMQSSNNNLYICGQSISDMDLANFYNLDPDKKEIEEFSLEKSTYPSSFLYKNGSFYTTAIDSDGKSVVYVHDSSKKCIATINISDSTNKMVTGIACGTDGNVYVETVTSQGMSMSNEIYVYGMDGKELNHISLDDVCGKGNGMSLYTVLIADDQNNLYTARLDINMVTGGFDNTVIYKLNSSLEKQFEINDFTDLGTLSNLFLRQDGKVVAVGTTEDRKMCNINVLDADSGETSERYEIDTASVVFQGRNEGEFIYYNQEGIYAYSLTDQSSSEIYSILSKEAPEGFKQGQVGVAVDDGNIVLYTVPADAGLYNICVTDNTGTVTNTLPLKASSNSVVDKFFVSPEDIIYYSETEYSSGRSQASDDEQEETGSTLRIHSMDKTGNELSAFDVQSFAVDQYPNLTDIAVDRDKNIYLLINSEKFDNENGLYVYDKDGNQLQFNTDEKISDIRSMITDKNGRVFAQISDDSSDQSIVPLDVSGKPGEPVETGFLLNDDAMVLSGDSKYDLYYTDNNSVYGYNFDTNKSSEIINWIDSDIISHYDRFTVVDSDTLACIESNTSDMSGKSTLVMLNRVDDAKLKQINNKSTLIAAGYAVDVPTSLEIARFNKANDSYRIHLYDYQKFNTDDDETKGLKQFSNDLVTGNVPDIVFSNDELSIDSYVNKGLLADLNKYIDEDNDIKREDYFENIFDIGSRDGKLYKIIPEYTIKTMIGKESVVGDGKWDIKGFIDYAMNHKDSPLFYAQKREDLEKYLIGACINQFVDFKKSTCSFTNDDFKQMLEIIKNNSSDEEENDDEYKEYQSRFLDDKCQLDLGGIVSFSNYNVLQAGYMQEKTAIKGVPCQTGSGVSISYDSSISISEKSKNKDGAWEFVRGYLLDNYQNSIADEEYKSGFPIKLSALEKMKKSEQDTKNNPYQTQYIGDKSVNIGVISDSDAQMIIDLIKSADSDSSYDPRIMDIVSTEAKDFYNGSADVDTAVAGIQKKVQTYLNEIK